MLAGRVLTGGRIFLDSGPSAAERVPVSKFWLYPGPLIVYVGAGWGGEGSQGERGYVEGEALILGKAGLGHMTCGFGLLSLKSNSVSH